MKSNENYYIIWHKQNANDGIVLDGFKCAFKGSEQEMYIKFKEFYQKAVKLAEMGIASEPRVAFDDDGTMSFRFERDGKLIRTWLCSKHRASMLMCGE